MPLLSIVIPAYNEAGTIGLVLGRVLAAGLEAGVEREIIVVDDCSGDSTKDAAASFAACNPGAGIRILSHEVNRGKGAAVHTGIAASSGDFLMVQDADLEYDPADINLLLAPMLRGEADVVYGSRFMETGTARSGIPGHRLGNRLLTVWSNLFTGFRLTDMETCYKLFKAPLVKSLKLREPGFGFEPEVTARISRIPGIRIMEVPVSYRGRSYGEGKKIGLKDAAKAVYCSIRYSLLP